MYRDQKARIAELEAALATRGVKPAVVAAKPAVKVTHFTKRDGSQWERRTCGSRSWVLPKAEAKMAHVEVEYLDEGYAENA